MFEDRRKNVQWSLLAPFLFLCSCLWILIGLNAAEGYEIPRFALEVPTGHFVGVSPPVPSLSEARKAALADTVKQILRAIGIEYQHRFEERVYGDAKRGDFAWTVDDRLNGFSKALLRDVEMNLARTAWSDDASGRYVAFVLVYYPDALIRRMRLLNRGPELSISIISDEPGTLLARISEINGASVVLTAAVMRIINRNRHAKAITLFLCRVPETSERAFRVSIESLRLCGDSAEIRLPLFDEEVGLRGLLLGAERRVILELTGQDELGREVRVETEIHL